VTRPTDAVDIAAWYRRYGPMVLRRCKRLLGDDALAEEAMQDVFANLMASRDRLHGTAPSSLLYQSATNVSLNVIRARKCRPEVRDADLLAQIAVHDGFEGGVGARDMLARVFGRQKPGTGLIATLHLVDGLTLEEVAHEVGMSVSGVRKRLDELRRSARKLGVSP
jgi:RNA polymerase sigma-70 factor (ECF subfamily)